MKQSNYQILNHGSKKELSDLINSALSEGYLLAGGVTFSSGFYQSIYRETQEDTKPDPPNRRPSSEVKLGDKVIFFKSRSKYLTLHSKEYEVIECSDVLIVVMGDDGHDKTIWLNESYYRFKIVQ